MQSFLEAYPGVAEPRADTPVGFPGWLGWQHFFNSLIVILLIRSGWQVRTTQRPAAYWTRRNDGLLKTKNAPKKISLDLWFHLNLAALLVVNGAIFYLLLFITGQWKRLVPNGLDVFPNAASTAIQYASLHWPTENGWVNYNALQLLAYFATVFIAAPLAILTGVRMSGAWPRNTKRLNTIYPIELARKVHFPVMLYFVGFIIVHVTLVLATGARNNLNHMYAMRDDGSWIGLGVFAASVVVIVVAWVGAQPVFLQPVASLTGNLSRR
ncbi:cytochrome b/b6 domain-containing protein [Mycobacterium sp. M1]|uniref:Cytochrome b/b6 domain-containing protein n=2 Tax=Mycolicibacter acidiphilus TaxID=2835306 RepID=A0ABS5RM72_9MYCO|nr:cytochrome b/b6 domain-containing protein [Mycolicibacter acidiphilus]